MEKKRIINIKTVGIALAGAMVTLVFFSRTIYSYNLPVVTAVMPEKGTLSKFELSSGIVTFAREFDVYSELGGKISEVLVKEGDSVKAGEPLIYMDFGASREEVGTELEKSEIEAESKLAEMSVSTQKANVEIQKLELNIANTRAKIEELKNEESTMSDYELKQCLSDIEKAEESRDKAKILYEAGALPQSELQSAENALLALEEKRAHLEKTYAEQIEDLAHSKEKQLAELEHQLSAYMKDLDAKRLDVLNIQNQQDKLNSDFSYKTHELEGSLADYDENRVIRAEKDAVITSISVKEGQYVGANQKILSGGAEGDYTVECNVSLNNNFIAVDDTCRLSNTSHSLTGTVVSIKTLESAKRIALSLDDAEVSSDETFDIRFEKTSSTSYMLVPKAALNMDNDGYFLYRIKRREGIMGKEYYAEKLRVYIGDSDNENVAIIKGIDFPEPVALISDKPFSEGETIKLKNESDFFED